MDEAPKADGWTERRLLIRNCTKKLSMVFTEPLGEDFWLLPDDVVELRASFDDVTAGFEIDILAHGVVVYPSKGMGLFSA